MAKVKSERKAKNRGVSQFLDLSHHVADYGCEFVSFTCGDPLQPDTLILDTELLQDFFQKGYPPFSFEISVDVVAV